MCRRQNPYPCASANVFESTAPLRTAIGEYRQHHRFAKPTSAVGQKLTLGAAKRSSAKRQLRTELGFGTGTKKRRSLF
jgi:hypothetical protein